MQGQYYATITSNTIQANGQQLTFTRPAKVGGNASTQSLYCLPQPLTPTGASQLGLEGAYNLSEETAHDFVVAGSADVKEADTISYDGHTWTVLTTIHQKLQGVNVSLHCVATRNK